MRVKQGYTGELAGKPHMGTLGADVVSTHVERTKEDPVNMIGVPLVICRLSRMVGLGAFSQYMPFLYGWSHTIAVNGMNAESIIHAVISGAQSHMICKNMGLQ
jgi:hypothetical protein